MRCNHNLFKLFDLRYGFGLYPGFLKLVSRKVMKVDPRLYLIALVVVLALNPSILASTVYAASLTVNSTSDTVIAGDGQCTLREALLNANEDNDSTGGDCSAGSGDDSITFSVTGSIMLDSSLPSISTNITISGPGAAVLTLDGKNASSIFTVNSIGKLNLEKLTLSHAMGTGFGAIINYGILTATNSTFSDNMGGIVNSPNGSITITDCVFSDNYVGHGGGIYNDGGSVTVTNSTFSGNTGTITGGGIHSVRGTLTVTGSTFSNNITTENFLIGGGGGIYNSNGTAIVTNTTFSDNIAGYWMGKGGGILSEGVATLIVKDSTFTGNFANAGGGGIYNGFNSRLTVDNSAFFANSASIGGGIYNQVNSIQATITNSTFSGNFLNYYPTNGGGIANAGGMIDIIHSTFSGNSSAIYNSPWNSTVTLHNTILTNSTTRNCEGEVIDGGFNLQFPADGGCDNPGFLTADPILGPLQDNGGLTFTHALLLGSPAIDAVPLEDCAGVAIDQRGVERPQGPACDIGAFELETPQQGIEELIEDVLVLTESEALNQGQANSLIAKLEAAIQQLDQGNEQVAIHQLEAFIRQVEAMVRSGVLLSGEGEALIEAANEIIAILSS